MPLLIMSEEGDSENRAKSEVQITNVRDGKRQKIGLDREDEMSLSVLYLWLLEM